MEKTALVVHGHFYQPPRENPWTGTIEPQPGARPFDNWNERIHSECYRPNAFARVLDTRGRVERIVNNYEHISFNFGPTLAAWLERFHPTTYARIIAADRTSALARSGHGNAIAQSFHHSILPLCNERDRRTEIRWGVADFRRRFGRSPESLWLPETACDDETLCALIDEGLAFVILSPFQAARVRALGAQVWESVVDGLVDTTISYRYFHRDASGRSIAVFFYDGQLAKSVAFDGFLASSHLLVERFERAAATGRGSLVHLATDGETYGHHFKYGDRCLAYALEVEAPERGLRVTNYGEFLAEHEPAWEIEIKHDAAGEGTAWSCAHGLGRWLRDCSCHASAPEGWHQRWRDPLRRALNFLRDEASQVFEDRGGELIRDVWRARDDYVEVLLGSRDRANFLREQSARVLGDDEQVRTLTLLEMQRAALMMFTSCGWFFNDISGIESVQILRYAARVLDLIEEVGVEPPRAQFLELLAEAESNKHAEGNGADIFRTQVETARVTPARVAASLAISSLVADHAASGETAGYDFARTDSQQRQHGRLALSTARIRLESRATGRRFDYTAAAMHFGDVDFYCALREFASEEKFSATTRKLWDRFRAASLPSVLGLMREEFGPDEYGLEHLLSDDRRRAYEIVFGRMITRFTEQYEFLYEENRRNIEMLQDAGFELPAELRAAAEFTVGRRFEAELQRLEREPSHDTLRAALLIADEVARLGYRLDRARTRRRVERLIARAVSSCVESHEAENFEAAFELIRLAHALGLDADIERAQEIVYEAVRREPARGGMRGLALVLHLSPRLFEHDDAARTDEANVQETAIRQRSVPPAITGGWLT
jgi:alpha-amylase/alpha-mannosidase (GH57 family)